MMNSMMGMGGMRGMPPPPPNGMQCRGRMNPQQMMRSQIGQGLRDGTISKSEMKSLRNRDIQQQKLLKKYMSDGQLSLKEKMALRKYSMQTAKLINKYQQG